MSRIHPPVSIIGAPTDIGAGTRGARMGPEALTPHRMTHKRLTR